MKKETKKTSKSKEAQILSICRSAAEKYGKGTPEASTHAVNDLLNAGIISSDKKRQKIDVDGMSHFLHQYFYKTGVYVTSDTPKKISKKAVVKSCEMLLNELFAAFITRGEKIGVQYNGKDSIQVFAAKVDNRIKEKKEQEQKEQAQKEYEKLNKKKDTFTIEQLEKMLEMKKACLNA